MKALLLAGAVLATVTGSSEPVATVSHEHQMSGEGTMPGDSRALSDVPSPGPTTSESTTTTLQATTTTTTGVTTTTTVRPTQLAPVVHGDDFWYRLAMCESGAGASSPNIFQFMGGTARKVGYYPGASYEAQRAMAIDWAARIHPGEGTTAGWPVCWWRAGGS